MFSFITSNSNVNSNSTSICTYLRPSGRIDTLQKGDETVGNPHRAQINEFELFELNILLKLDEQCPVEQF